MPPQNNIKFKNLLTTSAIKGQSFNKTIEEQGGANSIILNIAANSIGEIGAKEIGNVAHGTFSKNLDGTIAYNAPAINQPTQLALHGILGATTSTLMGGDAIAGAAAGIVGEFAASKALSQGATANQAIALGQLGGATAAMFSSSVADKTDDQTAKNTIIGAGVGGNAAVNNALYVMDKKILNYPKGKDYDLNAGVQSSVLFREDSIGSDGKGTGFNAIPQIGAGVYLNL